MNNGVYALPGFMAPAAKNWKSQLLTNEDGSVKLCVYVGKPGTKVYYSLGTPGWRWGFIKDAQYFIDKGYPEDVIKEVSKFADYLEEELPALPEGTVIPDIIINGWPLPITESPIEGKAYWILNIPKFILPAGDTEVQISANGKLLKYTITRPDFSIHYNTPGYTIPAGTPGGGSSAGGLTSEERALLNGAAQRDADNTFTAGNIFTGSVDMSTAQVTPPSGWNVNGAELTAEAIQAVAPIAWNNYMAKPKLTGYLTQAIGNYGSVNGAYSASYGCGCAINGRNSFAIGNEVETKADNTIGIGAKFTETADSGNVTHTCKTQGTGSITIGAGANTLNNGSTESSNSVTIGCKASNKGADSVVIGASATNSVQGSVLVGAACSNSGALNVVVGKEAQARGNYNVAVGRTAETDTRAVAVGYAAKATQVYATAIGCDAKAKYLYCTALGYGATTSDYGATVIRSTAEDGTYTQLYFSGANTPLANTYHGGAPMLGYVTKDSAGNIVAAGTRSLIDLLTENSTFAPASLDENGEWVMPKVFHPSDLDLPTEEPTETEEYTPLPVYPIVEPEIEDINLINAE